ncbi:MAG: helix-turn-helix transcriptional regulator [Myxococcales bacterium]|nr:helix-turn-helix transcriptional regulator [Myxococcales bacterium]
MPGKRRRPERKAQYESAVYQDLLARVASAVRRLRQQRAWTQEEAAHRCDMSTRLLQQVEAGTSNLTFTTLARLSAGFEVDASRLIGRPRPWKA